MFGSHRSRKKKLSNRERKQQAKAEREEKKHEQKHRKDNATSVPEDELVKDFGTIAI